MNAIAYIRYASKNIGGRIEIWDNPQENAIKDYCTTNHINLCEIFHDIGVSGADFEHQGWQQLETYLDRVDGFIELLIVSDYDRISRNLFEGRRKIEYLQNRYGLTILALSDSHISDGDELRKLLGGKVRELGMGLYQPYLADITVSFHIVAKLLLRNRKW